MAQHNSDEKIDSFYEQSPDHEILENKGIYRAILENSRDALLFLTRDKFIDCNRRAVEIFGFKNREELLRHPPWELSPPEQPGGDESLPSAKRKIDNAFEGGKEHFEWKHKRADGTEFWADVKLSRINPGKKPLLMALIRDISGQKEKEKQLQAANQQLKAQNQQLDAYNQQLRTSEQQLRTEINRRQKIVEKLSQISKCFISLGEKPYENIDRLVETAGRVMDAEAAAYNRLDEENNKFKNLSGWELPGEVDFDDKADNHPCIRVINRNDIRPVYIEDLSRTKFYQTDPVLEKHGFITFLGIPVRINDDTIGSFCILTGKKQEFSNEEVEIMKILGRAVGREEKRLADRQKLSRYVDLKNDLERALEEKETLLKEVHHRVKNNMQQIISILSLQQLEIKNEKIVTILQKSQERVQAMGLIHNLLYKFENLTEIQLDDYLAKLIHQLIDAYLFDKDIIDINLDFPEDIYMDVDDALACGLVVNELIANALCHGLANGKCPGKLSVELESVAEDKISLTIADSGPGFPSRKEFENPNSLGLQLVRGIASRELQGEIELSQNDQTRIKITFPY